VAIMPPNLYQTLQLRLSFANGLQLLKRVIKDNLEGKYNATTVSIISYKHNAQSKLAKRRDSKLA
jgi:hypothetical protein